MKPAIFQIALCLMAVLPLQGCFERGEPISPKTALPLPGLNSSVSSLTVTAIDGMSAKTALRLRSHLRAKLAEQRITLVSPPKKAAFSIKGYGSVISDKKSLTLVNIWDVHDVQGRRVHRIMSESSGPLSAGQDEWAAVNSIMLAKAAGNLAAQYSAWSRGKKLIIPASAKRAPRAAPSTPPLATASIPLRGARTISKTKRTGIPAPIARSAFSARITGASGTGRSELAKALTSALNRNGYQLIAASKQPPYRLAVRVQLGPLSSGMRDISIDWKLTDRSGRHLGTVKQRKRVRPGAAERNWDHIAQGAANAAVNQIIKLVH